MKPAAASLASLISLALAGCQVPLAPTEPPEARGFDAALVARGGRLAAIGNCHSCHTARGGAPFAGGVPLESPFGTIYSTNITPDRDTGIGLWSEAAFVRAMRDGVRADGEHLYPAFPYDRFTHVTDEDNRALYAYLMSQPPVRAAAPRNQLVFPFNVRAAIAVWKRLYFRPGPLQGEPPRDARVARGRYLVEGLGHCGSCHSPRNRLYAERRERAYDGGETGGWHAYAINGKNAAPEPWDVASLTRYLREGYHPRHGVSRGTMGVVTAELAHADEADVRAVSAYVVSLMGRRDAPRAAVADARGASQDEEGRRLYELACHGCHDGSEPLPFGGLPLRLSIGLHGESPRNLVNVILHGLPPAEGTTTPMMPGYAGALGDAQVATLAAWLRARFTDKAPWSDLAEHVAAARVMTPHMMSHPPGGAGADPAVVSSGRR